MTEVVDCAPTQAPPPAETAFEKKRGVSSVEVRSGFALVHVDGLGEPLMQKRIGVLRAIANIPVSIDFLKLTTDGLSFLARHDQAPSIRQALDGIGVRNSVSDDRSIVLVHAVNIRDEEGLIARIIQEVIQLAVSVDHVGDMHDRLLLVLENEDAKRIAAHFQRTLVEKPGGKRAR
jgi:aspartokinase